MKSQTITALSGTFLFSSAFASPKAADSFYGLPAWPPANGLNTILVPRNETGFTIIGEQVHIDAPACLVWNVLRNTTAFPEWNTFAPAAKITLQPLASSLPASEQALFNLGTEFTYTLVLDASAPENKSESNEKVFDISTPEHPSDYVPKKLLKNDGSFYPNLHKLYRAVWGDNGPYRQQGLLISERFNEIIDLGGKKGCVYRTWENQGGPFAPTLQQMLGETLNADFTIWAKDMKAYSEKIYKAQKGHHY